MSDKKLKRDSFLNLRELKERGWTKKLITDLLKDCDREIPNPFYKSATPSKLYLKDRVISLEGSEDFINYIDKIKNQREKARKRLLDKHEKSREELFNYIESLEIKVPKYPKEDLIDRACIHYNDFHSYKAFDRGYSFTPATKDSDEDFLKRITINYLRHNLTNYEFELEKLFGKVGRVEAYFLIKSKINKAIIKTYPFLK